MQPEPHLRLFVRSNNRGAVQPRLFTLKKQWREKKDLEAFSSKSLVKIGWVNGPVPMSHVPPEDALEKGDTRTVPLSPYAPISSRLFFFFLIPSSV
jgi:hypothetical protein